MKTYRRVWLALCVPTAVIGFSVGVVFVPVPLSVMTIFFGAVSAIGTWLWLWQDDDAVSSPRHQGQTVARTTLVVGTVVGAFVGFTTLLGARGGFLVVISGMASSPRAVRAYGRWLLAVPTPTPAQLETMATALGCSSPPCLVFQPSSGVGALTDEELCRGWRASYTALLHHQGSAARIAETAAERQTYLDELERRNPHGFAAWLASGARAPGDPLPFLTQSGADTRAIDWDELTGGPDW